MARFKKKLVARFNEELMASFIEEWVDNFNKKKWAICTLKILNCCVE